MASSPAFVGPPRAEVFSLTTGTNSGEFTAGISGSIVRRIWAAALTDDAALLLTVQLNGLIGSVSIPQSSDLTSVDAGVYGAFYEVLLSNVFPGLSGDDGRHFEMGASEVLTLVASKSDGSALDSGSERIDVRVTGADY